MKGLTELIAAARGDAPCDIVLRNARIVNTCTREIIQGDVGIKGDRIAGIGRYEGLEEVDLDGRYVAPGFIEAHFHIESTLLRPSELARIVVPRGTTSMVCDPHEIANVSGINGIEFLLADSDGIPLDIFLMAPSCVPATVFDTSGASISTRDIEHLYTHPRVLGLGEVMNFPAVVNGQEAILEKIRASEGRPVDGHAPLLTGKSLCAYIAAGPRSDHECSDPQEALEKCRLGMRIMIRLSEEEPETFRELLSLVNDRNYGRFMLVTDDRPADALFKLGHLDYLLKRSVEEGLDPLTAISMVTLNPASHFGFRELGAVSPGNMADLVVLGDLSRFDVLYVYKSGRRVGDGGHVTVDVPPSTVQHSVLNTIHLKPFSQKDFMLRLENPSPRARIMELVPGTILTSQRIETVKVDGEGYFLHDPHVDLAAVHVLDRHTASGRIGRGLVRGFGLRKGAIASTFSHDSHNIICVSTDPESAHTAVEAISAMGGGYCVAVDNRILGSVRLPISGLLSNASLSELLKSLERVHQEMPVTGCALKDPFLALSFLSLTVVPELRITDRGLFDVNSFEPVDLEMVE